MKSITTQKELDNLKEIKKDERFSIDAELKLNHILSVYGKLIINKKVDCCRWNERYIVAWGNSSVEAWGNSSVVAWENSSVVAWGNSSVEAWGNSSVVAWGNSSVVAWGNSSVEAWGNSSVVARGNSSVEAWGNSSVEARGNSSVVARGNSSVVARENSSVEARENSSVEAWGNSSVVAWGNSSVEARENSVVRLIDKIKSVILNGFSICFMPIDLKFKIEVKSKYAHIQKIKDLGFFERNGIKKENEVILYKRVSNDYKTQEGTENETLWKIDSIVEHKNWNPKEDECGKGKFHACSKPYFCDEFRSTKNDRYIAIKIDKKDLYEWKKPQYPHKIAFKIGKVLYEVNKFGKELK